MRQRPCQIPCHQHVEALRLEVRVFCVHDPERGVQPQNGGHMLGVLDHVRCQVDAGRLVPLGGKQAGEEAGTRADVQDPERPPLRQIPEKLREPARPLLAVEFTQSLRFKGLRPVRPVVSYAMLDQFHMLPSLLQPAVLAPSRGCPSNKRKYRLLTLYSVFLPCVSPQGDKNSR